MSRFQPAVERALAAGGWFSGRSIGADKIDQIRRWVLTSTGSSGERLVWFPAAETVLDEFGGLTFAPAAGGTELRPRSFSLDPALPGATTETLYDAIHAIGMPLVPLGVEGLFEGILAVTEQGQVLVIDAVGEWFLGETIDAALDTLLTGRAPARIDDRGGWPGRVRRRFPDDPDGITPMGVVEEPVGAAFFLPRTPLNPHRVWLPDTLRRIGLSGRPFAPDPPQHQVSWAGLTCYARVLDLEAHTVLLIVFDYDDYTHEIRDADRERPTIPSANPLAWAFLLACTGLQPELQVAFVQTEPVHDLEAWVVDHEPDILDVEAWKLVERRLPLLYLDSVVGRNIPALPGRYEMSIPDGRILLRNDGDGAL